jgi:2-polyprenyl-3-methyl-5-hydroxy-6-metoxy-1,4-benzoquinol methylase
MNLSGSEPVDADVSDSGDDSDRLERYLILDKLHAPYLRWQLEQFQPFLGQRILEIGCGVGGIVAQLGSREFIYGLDVEAPVLESAAERFRDRPECRFELLDISTCSTERLAALKSHRFDSIVCINVLEHIRDDIGALQRMHDLLEPGGVLCLLVPAHLGLYGPYDELDGHYRRYSRAYLRTILRQTTFRELRMYYFNALGAVGWWWQYRVFRGVKHGSGAFGGMKLALPVVRRVERILKPPFGLSVVAVLRRP